MLGRLSCKDVGNDNLQPFCNLDVASISDVIICSLLETTRGQKPISTVGRTMLYKYVYISNTVLYLKISLSSCEKCIIIVADQGLTIYLTTI